MPHPGVISARISTVITCKARSICLPRPIVRVAVLATSAPGNWPPSQWLTARHIDGVHGGQWWLIQRLSVEILCFDTIPLLCGDGESPPTGTSLDSPASPLLADYPAPLIFGLSLRAVPPTGTEIETRPFRLSRRNSNTSRTTVVALERGLSLTLDSPPFSSLITTNAAHSMRKDATARAMALARNATGILPYSGFHAY